MMRYHLLSTILYMMAAATSASSAHASLSDISPDMDTCMQEYIRSHRARTMHATHGTLMDNSDTTHGVQGANVEDNAHIHCVKRFFWGDDIEQWKRYNITRTDVEFINSLISSTVMPRRTKRQAGNQTAARQTLELGSRPPSGFRFRHEYRMLSDRDRRAFHNAVNVMKFNGLYDTFANMHSGNELRNAAHNGPNFLSWHRIYLVLFEEALRRIDNRVSLPYWDSSLDFELEHPVNSIMWTDDFLGNGDGVVTAGPCAGWRAPNGRLTRNINSGGRLVSKEALQPVLSRCLLQDIMHPAATNSENLELVHNGVHSWIGGQMTALNFAAHDLAFFLHHCFIDHIWELFRRRQFRLCGVNPESDYPQANGSQALNSPMFKFPVYTNEDGIRNYWTRNWYNYEAPPYCSWFKPSCGSPYLECDWTTFRCKPTVRTISIPRAEAIQLGANIAQPAPTRAAMVAPGSDGVVGAAGTSSIISGEQSFEFTTEVNVTFTDLPEVAAAAVLKGLRDVASLGDMGPLFESPGNDPRVF